MFDEMYKYIKLVSPDFEPTEGEKEYIESQCKKLSENGCELEKVIDIMYQFVCQHFKWKDALKMTELALIFISEADPLKG